ncbi:MAG: hypothetical protein HYZ50_14895 [Deltaproteobacteria bacterium]|nr:hypothetical protein [Deltaproteobacteria bacterium]
MDFGVIFLPHKKTTLTGTPDEVRVQIRKMAARGVKQVAVAGDQSLLTEFATHVIRGLP